MKVTRNECLDRLRRQRPQAEWDDSLVEEGGPLTEVQTSELARSLTLAIGQLKEPYRSLVVLRDVQQHSYQEVAQTMELSMSQVKVYLHRARKLLREQLVDVQP